MSHNSSHCRSEINTKGRREKQVKGSHSKARFTVPDRPSPEGTRRSRGLLSLSPAQGQGKTPLPSKAAFDYVTSRAV